MKNPDSLDTLEKKILSSFQRKIDILFLGDREYLKFMIKEIYPLVQVKIITRYFKGADESKLISGLTEKDKLRFEFLKKLKYIHIQSEKEIENAINTILRLIKDIHIFLAKVMELLVLLDIKTESAQS